MKKRSKISTVFFHFLLALTLLKNSALANTPKNLTALLLLNPPRENIGADHYDHDAVIQYLKESLDRSLYDFKDCLSKNPELRKKINRIESHWINRSIVIEFSKKNHALLTRLKDKCPIIQSVHSVETLVLDTHIEQSLLTDSPEDPLESYRFTSIGLDRVLKENPELRGMGVVIGELDTGVDGTHPSLVGRTTRFLDAKKKKEVPAFDSSGHGTHVAGVLVGEDLKNKTRFGIAPDAKLMAASALDDYASLLYAMEWILSEKNVHVVNNSWSIRANTDPTPFYKAIEAWEASGILPVFSAGNAGPRLKTITIPHEHPLAFAVGATDKIDSVIGMSSRGPGIYLGKSTEKPDLVAPGDDIYSALPHMRYGTLSGSSMAAPHVAGSVAILLQLKPDLSPKELRHLLISCARPGKAESTLRLSNTDWDPAYGAGQLDLYAAVQKVKFLLKELEAGGRAREPIQFFNPILSKMFFFEAFNKPKPKKFIMH